mgnify:CR=1 FL=1
MTENYEAIKTETPLDVQVKVLEDLLDIERAEIKRLKQQLDIQRVTFCLPIEGDTFTKWFDKHFVMLDNTMVEAKNQPTIRYSQDEILELYSFLTDRLSAN